MYPSCMVGFCLHTLYDIDHLGGYFIYFMNVTKLCTHVGNSLDSRVLFHMDSSLGQLNLYTLQN